MYMYMYIYIYIYSPNKALAAEGFLLPLLVISFGFQDFPSPPSVPKPRYLSPGT